MVAEIYSAPRVTSAAKLLPSLGVLPGFALDLTIGWDFTKESARREARAGANAGIGALLALPSQGTSQRITRDQFQGHVTVALPPRRRAKVVAKSPRRSVASSARA